MSVCRFCRNIGFELVSPMLDSAENVYQPCHCKYGQRVTTQQRFSVNSACLCEQKPKDKRYLNIDPKCLVHNPSSN